MGEQELDFITDGGEKKILVDPSAEISVNRKTKFTNKQIYKNVLITAVSALANFTGFAAMQNLQSSLHAEVGFTSLCILYASFMLSLFFLPNIVTHAFGYKFPIAASMIGYALFTLAQFYPKMWLMIIVGVIVGCSSGVFWAAVSSNITSLAIIHAHENEVEAGQMNQKFFAIFYAGFRFAQISGNLISSLMLSEDASSSINSHRNSSLTASLKCGVDFCPGVNDHVFLSATTSNATTDSASSATINNPSGTVIRNLILVYLSISIVGVALVLFFLADLKKHGDIKREDRKTLRVQMKEVSLLFMEKPIRQLSSISIYVGVVGGFIYGDLTKAFISCALGIQHVGYGMICYGVAALVGSIVTQGVVRKLGLYTMSTIGYGICLIGWIWLLVWDVTGMPKYFVYITICVLGLGEVISTSQTHGFFGVMYPEKKEAAFSVFKLLQSFGNMISFAYGNHLCIQTKIIIVISLFVVGFTFYSRTYYQYYHHHRNELTTIDLKDENSREDKLPLK